MAKKQGKPVLVTTEHRGVFFGFEEWREQTPTGLTIRLNDARNCLYWSVDVKGFIGLAIIGPTKSCRIGPAVSGIDLAKVTSICDVTPEAAKAWGDAPWAR